MLISVHANLLAQWPTSAGANLAVADGAGEQVLPKVAPLRDGGCYVGWFENRSGSYAVRLQERLPGRRPIWFWRDAVVAKRLGDGGTRDDVPDVLQGFKEACVAPTRVLLGHPQDRRADVLHHQGPSCTLRGRCPLPRALRQLFLARSQEQLAIAAAQEGVALGSRTEDHVLRSLGRVAAKRVLILCHMLTIQGREYRQCLPAPAA